MKPDRPVCKVGKADNDVPSHPQGLRESEFDLAALLASARQSALHPGFLIHDSPREADLTAAIYRRIFDIPKDEEFSDMDAPIQYVITTTEPPPEHLKVAPWLVHEPFSSTEKARRFLGDNI